ncbi:DUF4194 domain-containing protein [Lysobacter capsici]|uniref:DUF4194 domain-containing protein n=1 Tax=Lysobacter capsici TaxID=435897 RepID=UPI000BBB1F09|nr:DUF4194 domain-containing protein [Lysobacter capsici]ATE71281.1 hypothetical protein CNO08_07870 [Lysobacter capsici]
MPQTDASDLEPEDASPGVAAQADDADAGERQTVRAPDSVKTALLELMKYGLLEESRKPNLYRTALTNSVHIGAVLDALDLVMRVDGIRGLAFIAVSEAYRDAEDEWSHPLVRRQRLNLEQSLLVAIMRHHYVAHEVNAGLGATDAQIPLDDLLPQLQVYLGGMGSDAQEKKRLLQLLEQLKVHGLVSDVDQHERVTIRPIIVHLANPESLEGLLHVLRIEGAVGRGSRQATQEDGP